MALVGSVAVDDASSAWALPAKKMSAMTTIAPAKSMRSASFAEATTTTAALPASCPTNTRHCVYPTLRYPHSGEPCTPPNDGLLLMCPDQLLIVLPELFDDDVTEPLLFCVTLVVLELLDDAAPVVTDAVELPVFEPLLVFEAFPPELPAVLPADELPLMLPPLADESEACELPFSPFTPDFAELSPEFETAIWLVPTHELWFTPADDSLELLAPPSPLLMVLLLESLVALTLPEFVWPTEALDVLVSARGTGCHVCVRGAVVRAGVVVAAVTADVAGGVARRVTFAADVAVGRRSVGKLLAPVRTVHP